MGIVHGQVILAIHCSHHTLHCTHHTLYSYMGRSSYGGKRESVNTVVSISGNMVSKWSLQEQAKDNTHHTLFAILTIHYR
jgi:hypothetical protein